MVLCAGLLTDVSEGETVGIRLSVRQVQQVLCGQESADSVSTKGILREEEEECERKLNTRS